MIRAAEALLVVEVLSPGSHRIDHVHKRGEYAEAGIGHYWILDVIAPVTLLPGDAGAVTGSFSTAAPFPVEIDLDALI